MRRFQRVACALIAGALLSVPALAASAGGEAERVDSAVDVLSTITEIPEKAIPPALLSSAHGIAIIPGVIKVGLVVGGQYGKGVLCVREADGSWSDPMFITLYSGSVGWQIGAESTDFVLVFKTARSVEGIARGKYTLGGDASVAAGPVGRSAKAATDIGLSAEIYSYSRSRGLFAGVSLDGSSLQVDDAANGEYYGDREIRPADILSGKVGNVPAGARRLKKALGKEAPPSR